MNYLLVVLSLMDVVYRRSPLAVCRASHNEVMLGSWESVDPSLGDHGITRSEPIQAIDMENLIIKKFVYEGPCTFAQFILANTSNGMNGVEIGHRLPQYHGKRDIILRLPMKLSAFKYFGVWCRDEGKAYAVVKIPQGFKDVPQEVTIGTFKNATYGVKGSVAILDGKTIRITGFSFDGNAPNATFAVGQTASPEVRSVNPTTLPTEGNDTTEDYSGPLPKYENALVQVKIPYGKTVCDYKWFGVYSHKLHRSLGHLVIPADLNVPADHEQNDIYWTTTTTTTTTSMTMISTSIETEAAAEVTATSSKGTENTTYHTSSKRKTTKKTSHQLISPPTIASGGKPESLQGVVFAAIIVVLSHFYVDQET